MRPILLSELNSPFNPIKLIRHLWSRRLLLLILPPIFVIATYLFIRFQMGEKFESSALIKSRTPAGILKNNDGIDHFEPPVFEDIFLNDDLLMDVVDKCREKFPELKNIQYEKLKKIFELKVITMRETIVVSEYSPMLKLTATGSSREIAHFAVSTWLEMLMDRYGQMRAQEAQAITDSFQASYDQLSVEAEEIQKLESKAQNQVLSTNNYMSSLYRQLNGMGSAVLGSYGAASATSPGLYAEVTNLELELAELASSPRDEDQVMARKLKARLEKAQELLAKTTEQLNAIGEKKIIASSELERHREKLLLVREKMEQLREVISLTVPDAQVVNDPYNEGLDNEFSVMAWPQVPEYRVAPARSLLAIVAGIALSVLLLMLVVAEFYLKVALETEE
jgi:hypothetical protein